MKGYLHGEEERKGDVVRGKESNNVGVTRDIWAV
jgi:hypothetical protein